MHQRHCAYELLGSSTAPALASISSVAGSLASSFRMCSLRAVLFESTTPRIPSKRLLYSSLLLRFDHNDHVNPVAERIVSPNPMYVITAALSDIMMRYGMRDIGYGERGEEEEREEGENREVD